MSSSSRPSRKRRKRERRAAERHGLTLEQYRARFLRGIDRGAADPVEVWTQWRQEAPHAR